MPRFFFLSGSLYHCISATLLGSASRATPEWNPPIDAVYAHTAVAIGHELWTVPTASSYYYGFYELDEAAVADVAATLRHVLAVRGLRESEAEPPGSEEPPSFTEAALYPDLGEEYERGW